MEKTLIICDEKWFNNYRDNRKLSNIFCLKLDFKKDNIITEIKKTGEYDNIILVNNFDGDSKILESVKENIDEFNSVVFSRGLNTWDFSKIQNDVVLGFCNKKLEILIEEYPSVIDLMKYMIQQLSNNKKTNIKIINSKNNVKKIETDENRILKKNKKRPVYTSTIPYKELSHIKNPSRINKKPKILFICDVEGWAWWIKSKYIKKYLDPYYDIDIINIVNSRNNINYQKYDLYFTYGYSYVKNIMKSPFERRISGITAHRPIDMIKSKMGKVGWTHANSVLLYSELKKIHPNIFYVPNGVDSGMFQQKKLLQNDNMVFGHIGKLSPKKGQLEYIEPAIKKSGVKYFSHYNNYKKKIKHTEMPKLYNNFDVFICASTEDGTPCPALEAASSGIPIISNKIGNMPELIENYKTGILLEKKDIDLYIDAIKWCQKNPERVLEMGNNIRKKIETEWTWELMSKNYLYLFDSILQIERDASFYLNPAQFHIRGE